MFGLLSYLFITINLPKIPTLRDIPTINIEKPKITSGAFSYSDSSFQNQSVNFSPGQTVYVLVKTSLNADYAIINLTDNNKNTLSSYKLSKIDSGYTTSFNAPTVNGIYYLDIEIKSGENNIFKSQSNINVGDTGGNEVSIVGSNIIVNVNGEKITPEVANLPTLKLTATTKPVKKTIPHKNIPLQPDMKELSSLFSFFWEKLKSIFAFIKPIGS